MIPEMIYKVVIPIFQQNKPINKYNFEMENTNDFKKLTIQDI